MKSHKQLLAILLSAALSVGSLSVPAFGVQTSIDAAQKQVLYQEAASDSVSSDISFEDEPLSDENVFTESKNSGAFEEGEDIPDGENGDESLIDDSLMDESLMDESLMDETSGSGVEADDLEEQEESADLSVKTESAAEEADDSKEEFDSTLEEPNSVEDSDPEEEEDLANIEESIKDEIGDGNTDLDSAVEDNQEEDIENIAGKKAENEDGNSASADGESPVEDKFSTEDNSSDDGDTVTETETGSAEEETAPPEAEEDPFQEEISTPAEGEGESTDREAGTGNGEELPAEDDAEPESGQDGEWLHAGSCGDEAVWRFYEDGTLEISGTGDLWDNHVWPTSIGWLGDGQTEEDTTSEDYIYYSDIKKVVIGEDITSLGACMFSYCQNLESVTFHGSAPAISPVCAEGYFVFVSYDHTIYAYYPEDDNTWTEEAKNILSDGANILWFSYDSSGKINLFNVEYSTVTGITSKVWTGEAITQSPVVTYMSYTLKEGTDYTLEYEANKNVGTAAVSIIGKGIFTGEIKEYFRINPKGTTLLSLTPAKGKFTAAWAKQASQITGYQLQYSKSNAFSSGNKMVKISGPESVKRAVTGLGENVRYYVRIRTYKKIGDKTYYSAWSASKNCLTVYNPATLSAAVKYVRGQAQQREKLSYVMVTEDVKKKLDLKNCSDILAHTGAPTAGDYLKNSISYSQANATKQSDGKWLVEYYFSYWDTKAQEQKADAAVIKLVSSLKLKDTSISKYKKIKSIHDYICKNVKYDEEHSDTVDRAPWEFCGYGAIVKHQAVCQGYASMFYRLALEAGIDCRIISSSSLDHAWNIVKLGSKYYNIDCTWDSINKDSSFFLCGKYDFGISHENTDDELNNAVFAKKYPVFNFKYGQKASYGKSEEFLLRTFDDELVSTAAQNGRAKVLIFFSYDCPFSDGLFESLNGEKYPGIDFVYVYEGPEGIESTFAKEINKVRKKYKKKFPELSGVFAFSSQYHVSCTNLERQLGIYDGWVNSPTVVVIDGSNNVRFGCHGVPSNFDAMLRELFVNKKLSAKTVTKKVTGDYVAFDFCGYNAIWRYYKDGTLRISGKGNLWSCNCEQYGWLDGVSDNDWANTCYYQSIITSKVKKVIIEKDIGALGVYMFYQMKNVKTFIFKQSAPRLKDQNAFIENADPNVPRKTYGEIYKNWSGFFHDDCKAKIYYPKDDKTWTASIRKLLTSGKVVWVAQ